MNDKIMQIPVQDLLESLKAGYEEYKECLENGNDEVDLAHVKGFCVTIEQILAAYGGVSKDEMKAIKQPIIGDISLRRKDDKKSSKIDMNADLDTPTVLRRESALK
mgnify:CR=1 FL=1